MMLYECWKLNPGPLEEQAVLSHLSSLDCSSFLFIVNFVDDDDDVVLK